MVSKIKSKMMSKIGYVTARLAREFLLKNKDERIETVGNLAKKFETGRGTVQAALGFLVEHQAIKLESKGHLGTFIQYLDYKLLWEIADAGIIMGLMPLPYSPRYEGLATGLNKEFKKAQFPFSMAFTRGAKNRLNVLEKELYDFILVSRYAAEEAIKNNNKFEIAVEFGPGSYLSRHVIVFAEPGFTRLESGMTVGIDPSSIDHKFLTALECQGLEVNLKELTYMKILEHIKSKKIDAAIWNYDEIVGYKRINYASLHQAEALAHNEKISNAVILINKDDYLIKNVLQRTIKKERVLEIQQQVFEHNLIPEY